MSKVKLAVMTALAVLLLAACSSGSTGSDTAATAKPKASESTSASPSAVAKPRAPQASHTAYFTAEDSEAINKAAAAAQSAGTRATAARGMTTCNKITAYPGWRRCWHGLLDPYTKGLTDLAAVLTSLRADDLPEVCQAELGDSAQIFTSFAGQVKALLAGIDSDQRSEQVRAAQRYSSTMDHISGGFTKPFQDLTQVCYSPEELASINASPTPSP